MIVALVGENDVMRMQEQARLIADFVAEHGDMALERLDGEEVSYEQIMAAVQSLPFLVSKKLVLLRSPSQCKAFVEQFELFLKEVAEPNDILIVEGKLDKRLSYYKNLKKLTDFREFPILDIHGVARFVVEVAKDCGASLSNSDALYLVERVGANQLTLQHEVEKLALQDRSITRQTIDLMTEPAPQSTVFDLLEAAFAGNARRTMRLYDEQKALKVEPQQVIAMLAWQLHILALIQTAGQRSPDEIARDAKLNPFVVRKSVALARKLSRARLKELIRTLRQLDERTKADGTIPEEALRYYLLHISTEL